MVLWHLHVQRLTRVPKVFTHEHRALLANKQRSAVRVTAYIVGADGKISDLEALHSVHVQALVEYAVLDDRVAIARRHGARTEGVPGCFDVA
jgi:hypothetical protein